MIHLEPLFLVYAWNMPGIYHVYVDVLHIHGIYMVYPWIYHVYPSDWIYHVYQPSIYMVYPCQLSIYMLYPWIYMVYPLTYVHGIYLVYCGISMDIHSFLKPDFAGGQCCWSHSMRTRVCGWSRVFYSTRHHGKCPREKGCPQKAQPDCRQRFPPVAGGGSDCSGSGSVAGVFQFS